MKQLVIKPDGWPLPLAECNAGFFVYNDQLCFKSEYAAEMQIYNSSGENFCGQDRDKLIVQPVFAEWTDE
jgi:hypothetical protein